MTSQLTFALLIGVYHQNRVLKDIELLKTNGAAEKVFGQKLPEKPYTWMGNVITIATKTIGDIEVGAAARKEYATEESVTIPAVVKDMYLADVNSMLLEVHRRVWKNELKNQEVICKFCTKGMVCNIDLNKISASEEDLEKLEARTEWDFLTVDLKDGFEFDSPTIKGTNQKKYEAEDGQTFNRFIFRIPRLRDAIANEAYVDDTVMFWRRMAADCIVRAEKVVKDENGEETVELTLGREALTFYGLKLYNEFLYNEDLSNIREALREEVPTLPFAYKDECPCEMRRSVPVTVEASSFFSV